MQTQTLGILVWHWPCTKIAELWFRHIVAVRYTLSYVKCQNFKEYERYKRKQNTGSDIWLVSLILNQK